MTTAAELRTLAEEVEALTGPSVEINYRVMVAIGMAPPGGMVNDIGAIRGHDGAIWAIVRPLTASIDAAASLMPVSRAVEIFDPRMRGGKWLVIATLGPRSNELEWCHSSAATEPLARCAAALRARAAAIDAGAKAETVEG